jgi:hypothetical protein
MYDVMVRDIPARSLLCLLRHASNEQEVWDLGKEVIGMLKAQPVPVPQDLAGQLAASFPALTVRTEPAHQEAYSHMDQDATEAQWQAASDSALAWAAEHQRQPSDLGLRVTLLTTAAPVTDASRRGGSDFALPLRYQADAA